MWSSLTIKRGFWLLDGALVVCTVLLAVQIFNGLLAPPPAVKSSPKTPSYNSNPPDRAREIKPAEYYAAMAGRRIFGGAGASSSAKPAEPPPTSLDSLPPTSLTLTLLGTTIGMDDGMSRAIIANETTKLPKVYKEGDKIEKTATTVERILVRKVVLNRDGKREVLTFSLAKKAPAAAPPPRPTLSRRSSPSNRPRSSRPGYTMVDRSEWQELESRNPADLLDESGAKVTPTWKDGQIQGLQLENIAGNEYAKRLGLEEGDVVSSVNGVRIQSLDQAFGLATKLQKSPVIRVEVVRDGRPQTLTYRLK